MALGSKGLNWSGERPRRASWTFSSGRLSLGGGSGNWSAGGGLLPRPVSQPLPAGCPSASASDRGLRPAQSS